MSVETIKVVNFILVGVSLLANVWAILSLANTIYKADSKDKRNVGLVMVFGIASMSVLGIMTIVAYTTDSGHTLAYLRTTMAGVANIMFVTAYWLLKKGIL